MMAQLNVVPVVAAHALTYLLRSLLGLLRGWIRNSARSPRNFATNFASVVFAQLLKRDSFTKKLARERVWDVSIRPKSSY
jgi:hypothetical protein